jgi:hypothetical protein
VKRHAIQHLEGVCDMSQSTTVLAAMNRRYQWALVFSMRRCVG